MQGFDALQHIFFFVIIANDNAYFLHSFLLFQLQILVPETASLEFLMAAAEVLGQSFVLPAHLIEQPLKFPARPFFPCLIPDTKLIALLKQVVGFDLTPQGFAKYLTDKSYGKTYSSAAAKLRKAKSWDKVGDLNWGFKDGSAKAEKGFVNGLAAVLRPLNNLLAVLSNQSV